MPSSVPLPTGTHTLLNNTEFIHVKRRWKRYYDNKLLIRMRDDIRQKPQKILVYFEGTVWREVVQDLASWSRYEKLCMVMGSNVGFTKVQQLLQHSFMS
jgi:hypothetical protein